jgi:hypothetical protein
MGEDELESDDETSGEDLRKVMAVIATCNKCNGLIFLCVKDDIDKETGRQFGRLLVDGCNVHTVNIIVARTFKICESTKCEGMWPKKKRKKKT